MNAWQREKGLECGRWEFCEVRLQNDLGCGVVVEQSAVEVCEGRQVRLRGVEDQSRLVDLNPSVVPQRREKRGRMRGRGMTQLSQTTSALVTRVLQSVIDYMDLH